MRFLGRPGRGSPHHIAGASKGIGIGFGGAIWTPASLGGSYLWADLDAVGAVSKNTQPTPDDWDMETAGTARWTAYLCSHAKSATSHSGSQSLQATASGAGGHSSYQSGKVIVGNRLLGSFWANRISGSSKPVFDLGGPLVNGVASAGWQHVKGEATATAASIGLNTDTGSDVMLYDDVSIANLSVSGITCKGSLGNLAQATAVNMPWLSDANAPTSVQLNGRHVLYFDGTADRIVSSGAASSWPLHKAAGFTFSAPIYVNSGASSTNTIINTAGVVPTNHGVWLYVDATNQQVGLGVAGGAGTWVIAKLTGAGTLTKGAWHVLSVTWSSSGVRFLIDSAAAVTGTNAGSPSTNDATATLYVGCTSTGASFFNGAMRPEFVRIGAVSADELATLHVWTKSRYGL